MAMREMLPNQKRIRKVYNAIVAAKIRLQGGDLTLREMMKLSGVTSTSLMVYYIDRLAAMGLIKIRDGRGHRFILVGGNWTPPEPISDENWSTLAGRGMSHKDIYEQP